MSAVVPFTKQYLDECFVYDSQGKIFWKIRPLGHFQNESAWKIFNKRCAGKEAGYSLKTGYRKLNIKDRSYGIHQLIFIMHYGYLPFMVDHINGDPSDNRIENLRAATYEQNCRNRRTCRRNTSGRKGVSFNKEIQKWTAYIEKDRRQKYLGCFVNFADAVLAREVAEKEIYGEFSNDR